MRMSNEPNLSDNILLKDYIDGSSGLVDYQKLKNDDWLHNKLEVWEQADLSGYSKNEEFAFWLNAYNLFTLKGVLYELEKNPYWKGNTSLYTKFKFFVRRKFIIAGRKINLRNLENKILRKRFQDPRLHFAINCASYSCPFLPGRLFQAETLEEYLNQLTSNFINNPQNIRFNVEKQVVKVSMIFKWYQKDFTTSGGVLTFIENHHKTSPSGIKKYKVEYFKYNWALNDQSPKKSKLSLNI